MPMTSSPQRLRPVGSTNNSLACAHPENHIQAWRRDHYSRSRDSCLESYTTRGRLSDLTRFLSRVDIFKPKGFFGTYSRTQYKFRHYN